jgi:cell division septum initiation protein DivIVA
MVKIYGKSDAETEFLNSVNGCFKQIQIENVQHFNDFKDHPDKYKKQIIDDFDKKINDLEHEISEIKAEIKKASNDEKEINSQISRKIKTLHKLSYPGPLKYKIEDEIEELKSEKEHALKFIDESESQIIDLQRKMDEEKTGKQKAVENIDKDIIKVRELIEEFEIRNMLNGAWGVIKVINAIKNSYTKESGYYLINAFDIDVVSKALDFEEKILVENKIDHLLLSPKGIFVLETKSWKNFTENGIYKCTNQLRKTQMVIEKIFDEEFFTNTKYVIVTTKSSMQLPENTGFYSVHLKDLQRFIDGFDEVLSKDDIQLQLDRLLPHLNKDHIKGSTKAVIKMKTNVVKGKRFIKRIFKS